MATVQRNDVQHHSVEQVEGHVTDAVRIVLELVPGGLQGEAVLTAVIGLLAGKTVQFVQPQAIDLGQLGVDPRRLRSGH